MTARRRAHVLVVTALLVVAVAGCTSSAPSTSHYTYDPDKAAVDVDTSALRAQKAAAKIPDCPSSASTDRQVDGGLPPVTLPCLGGGRPVDLAGLSGRPTVLNFWAQTCGPCREEAPLFEQLHRAGAVRVLGVDFYDPLPDRALDFANELGLTYPQLADPEAATRGPMRVQGLPMTVFLASDGMIKHVEYGAVQSGADLARLVSTYLGVDVELG